MVRGGEQDAIVGTVSAAGSLGCTGWLVKTDESSWEETVLG